MPGVRTAQVKVYKGEGDLSQVPIEFGAFKTELHNAQPTQGFETGNLVLDHLLLHQILKSKLDVVVNPEGFEVLDNPYRIAHEVDAGGDWQPGQDKLGLIYAVEDKHGQSAGVLSISYT